MTLECVHYTIIILLFLWYNYVVGPMARPGARGHGPGLGLNYDNCVAGRPGLDILFAGRAGPGPHNSVCGPGPGLHNCCGPGPGLKSYLRVGPGPKFQARAGPYCLPCLPSRDAAGIESVASQK